MAGTVSFPNMGSNIDVQSIINAYVSAESATQTQMQQHVQDLQTESTSISGISSALSTLSSAISDLSDSNTIQSYTATSSGAAIATSVVGTPQPGTYSVRRSKHCAGISGLLEHTRRVANRCSQLEWHSSHCNWLK